MCVCVCVCDLVSSVLLMTAGLTARHTRDSAALMTALSNSPPLPHWSTVVVLRPQSLTAVVLSLSERLSGISDDLLPPRTVAELVLSPPTTPHCPHPLSPDRDL